MSPDIKFIGDTISGSRADTSRRTDGHDEANKRFSGQCKRASNVLPTLCRVLSLARTGKVKQSHYRPGVA